MDSKDRLLEMIKNGLLNKNTIILAFVQWNTNEDIEEMCQANEIELNLEEYYVRGILCITT